MTVNDFRIKYNLTHAQVRNKNNLPTKYINMIKESFEEHEKLMNETKDFGTWIRNYRILNDLTITEMADKLDMNQGTISLYETGKSRPYENNEEIFEKLFGVDMGRFREENTKRERIVITDKDMEDIRALEDRYGSLYTTPICNKTLVRLRTKFNKMFDED